MILGADLWRFQPHPEVWALVLGLAGLWIYAVRVIGPRATLPGEPIVTRSQIAWGVCALLTLWVASDWPMHDIGEQHLYSVHMLQHILFQFAVAPMALLATPTWLARMIVGHGRGYRAGLGLARRIAHITYRSEPELEFRFGRSAQQDEQPFGGATHAARGRYAVESYLDHQAGKLVRRFDANSYIVLTEALMSHDIARGRGSAAEALAGVDTVLVMLAGRQQAFGPKEQVLQAPQQQQQQPAVMPAARMLQPMTVHAGGRPQEKAP